MFSALETTWDQSARRRWTTLASFTLQALGLSLLLAIPLIWIQRPPQLQWLQPLALPAANTPPAPVQTERGHHTQAAGGPHPVQIIAPQSIPEQIAPGDNGEAVPAAPDLPTIGVGSGRGARDAVPGGLGEVSIAIPPRPQAVKPLLVSHWAEGNLVYRVRPDYPPIALQAGIHGAVELRAVISKAGTIENLVVVAGHPMLVKSAINAVRQWRYRPYLLDNVPIEVETEITVNFVLSGR